VYAVDADRFATDHQQLERDPGPIAGLPEHLGGESGESLLAFRVEEGSDMAPRRMAAATPSRGIPASSSDLAIITGVGRPARNDPAPPWQEGRDLPVDEVRREVEEQSGSIRT
jgi:hypothetical protein